MKKKWVNPKAKVQEFAANEYVATCYTVNCNVPAGVGYIEQNNIPGFQEGADFCLLQGGGCGGTHDAKGLSNPSFNALWEDTEGNVQKVFYFEGSAVGGDGNKHFATSWVVNPNAS